MPTDRPIPREALLRLPEVMRITGGGMGDRARLRVGKGCEL